jgi:hypothetical protein
MTIKEGRRKKEEGGDGIQTPTQNDKKTPTVTSIVMVWGFRQKRRVKY